MPNVPRNKLGLPTVSEIAHPGVWHTPQRAGGPLDYSNTHYLIMESCLAHFPLSALIVHTTNCTIRI